SLVQEAHEAAVERYYWAWLQSLDEIADPEQRLLQLIRSGLPGQQDRQLSQALNELTANASRSRVHAQLMSQLFDREVSLYLTVFHEGQATAACRLRPRALRRARSLVAEEHTFAIHTRPKVSSIDASAALGALVGSAVSAAGATMPRQAYTWLPKEWFS